MKKLAIIAVLSLMTVSAWSQGTILFQNTGVTFTKTQDRLVRNADGTPLTGTTWVAGLYYVEGTDRGADLASPDSGRLALGLGGQGLANFRVPTTTSPGAWLNSTAVGNARTLEGIGSGQTATLVVRVWNSAAFNSFAEAVRGGGIHGQSEAFNYTVPAPGSPVNQTYLNDFKGFTLVPEPSTIALGILGLGSLLLFRRRK